MTSFEIPGGPGVTAPARGGSTDEQGRRVWRIEFPPGLELLTSNDRDSHWGRRHRVGGAICDAAIVLARQAKIPRIERASIVVEFHRPTGRKQVVREVHNLSNSAKHAIDGVVRARVLPDDSDRYIAEVTFRPAPPPHLHPQGQLVLIIVELETPSHEQ